MRGTRTIAVLLVFTYSLLGQETDFHSKKAHINFKENKGQVSDQDNRPCPDVLFSGNNDQFVFHLKKTGISYQFNKVENWIQNPISDLKHERKEQLPALISISRLDIEWLNANPDISIERQEMMEGYDNYYTDVCPEGATHILSYKQITYKQLYKGIDLKWYTKNGQLKYDYLVGAEIDYKKIQLRIKGAISIAISQCGELEIKTANGTLVEPKPVVFQEGRQLKSNWKLVGNTASFEIENVDSRLPITIDPLVRAWGTYYGGVDRETVNCCVTDAQGNIYITGDSKSNTLASIATNGAYQLTYAGGSAWGDATLVKFDANGVRQWGTYYGGTGSDLSNWCCMDQSGNVYMAGFTTSTTSPGVFATVGCHQTSFGGDMDGFLAKFDSNGLRLWSTYYGGSGYECLYGASTDNSGNVYISGETTSSSQIATPGSYQSVYGGNRDGFLVQFNSAGIRQWATYYGGAGFEVGFAQGSDNTGNVYFCGYSNSTSNANSLATPGSFQPIKNTSNDAFLVKFDISGNRVWGTYFGGAGEDYAYSLAIRNSDLYLTGRTNSNGTNFITPGCHQGANGGVFDNFLSKFSLNGLQQWCTFYGGTGDEGWCYVTTNSDDDVFLSGQTTSSTGTAIATRCTYQDTYSGAGDAFFAKFSDLGERQWGSYFGGSGLEEWVFVHPDANGNIYLVGLTATTSSLVMTTAGSHQQNYGGGQWDGFLTKFSDCVQVVPSDLTPSENLNVCTGETTALIAGSACYPAWYNGPNGAIIGYGNVFTTPAIVTNTTFYIADRSCGTPTAYTAIAINTLQSVDVSINASNTITCNGGSVALVGSGASTYTWLNTSSNNASITITPVSQVTETLIGSNGTCTNSVEITIDVLQTPTVSVEYDRIAYCSGSQVTFTAGGAQTYSWAPANVLITTGGSSVVSNPLLSNTIFTVFGFSSLNNFSCQSNTTFSVEVLASAPVIVSPNVTICPGASASLYASGGNKYNWFVHPTEIIYDVPAVTVVPAVTSTYNVKVYSGNSCTTTRRIVVTVLDPPYVNAGNDTIINIGDPLFLKAQGEGSFLWSSDAMIPCTECRVMKVLPFTKTCYAVQITSQFGCLAHDEVCVEVVNDFNLYVPNSFTPNGDGINDVFHVLNFGIKKIELVIYNRWGDKLLSTDETDLTWDGYYKGKPCESGTYVYKILYTPYKGVAGEKTGSIALIK